MLQRCPQAETHDVAHTLETPLPSRQRTQGQTTDGTAPSVRGHNNTETERASARTHAHQKRQRKTTTPRRAHAPNAVQHGEKARLEGVLEHVGGRRDGKWYTRALLNKGVTAPRSAASVVLCPLRSLLLLLCVCARTAAATFLPPFHEVPTRNETKRNALRRNHNAKRPTRSAVPTRHQWEETVQRLLSWPPPRESKGRNGPGQKTGTMHACPPLGIKEDALVPRAFPHDNARVGPFITDRAIAQCWAHENRAGE